MKAIFCDRDGTLNFDAGYTHKREDFKPMPFIYEGLKMLQDESYRLFIVSNQSGIGRGMFTVNDMALFNAELIHHLKDVRITKILFCQHAPEDNCSCRKPKTEMIERVIKEYKIDRESSWVIGDMTSDIQMAKDAKLRSMLVLTGCKGEDGRYDAKPDFKAENMLEAAKVIIQNDNNKDTL
jgi:D-glycero-D-manno-heptose 1,7-bisphosphate phosphatase